MPTNKIAKVTQTAIDKLEKTIARLESELKTARAELARLTDKAKAILA